jgi:hypothetical protein
MDPAVDWSRGSGSVLRKQPSRKNVTTTFWFIFYRKEKKVRLHHSTTLFTTAESKKSLAKSHAAAIEKLPAEWLFYEEMSR